VLLYEIETNQTKKRKGTPKYMTTTFIKNDPPKALQFFEDKMAFTTGPIEL